MTTRPPVIRHAPVPAVLCGEPLACSELLPDDATLLCELNSVRGIPNLIGLLDEWLGSLGLPTGRLVIRPGIYLFADGSGGRWLAVDYLVPGTRNEADTGWTIQLNYEAGRTTPDDDVEVARRAALDRYVIPFDPAQVPTWMESGAPSNAR